MVNRVSSGVSVCGEGSGFRSSPCQRGEEGHSAGTTSEPVSGNAAW